MPCPRQKPEKFCPFLHFGNLCYTFSRGRSFSAVKRQKISFPHSCHQEGEGGRTGHDFGIHMTRRCNLHGLHPERYVRFPFVRSVSRVGLSVVFSC